jgi:hypothetical protein
LKQLSARIILKNKQLLCNYFFFLIIRYVASRQKRQEYNWQQIDIWAFRSSLPTGRQASSVPISKENKATGVIAGIHNFLYID